jgi:hypothetical protein
MSITDAPLDELETSNLATFWAGVRAGARMAAAIDADGMATGRLTDLVGTDAADEIARAVTDIVLRATKPEPQPKPDAPVRVPAQARPGGRPS